MKKKKIYSPNLGYRVEIGGPVVCAHDGKLLWSIGGPEFFPVVRNISRIELLESTDKGTTWSDPRLLLSGNRKAGVNQLAMVRLSSGRIIDIFSCHGGYDYNNFENCIHEGYVLWSDDNGVTWSKSIKIETGERYLSGVLSAIQSSSGRIIFPFGYLTPNNGIFAVSAVWSDDEGQKWKRSESVLQSGGSGHESGACEPSVVELPDGRIWMLIRTQSGFQYESFSCDIGETWTEARPSRIPSSNSPAVLLRLRSGRIVLVWNNCTHMAYARCSLMMAATDDGEYFFGFREIDNADSSHVSASSAWGVRYPYMCEGKDGHIFVSYNYGNWRYNQARLARIDPSWLEESQLVEDFNNGRSEWCTFQPSVDLSSVDSIIPPEDNAPGSILDLNQKEETKRCGIARNIPNIYRGEIKITATLKRPDGYILLHNSFINPENINEAVLRLRIGRNGKVFIGAGKPVFIEKNTTDLSKGPQYSYLGYPIHEEIKYPGTITLGKPFVVRVTCTGDQQEVGIKIDNGPINTIKIGNIMGFCYIGLAAAKCGHFQVRRIFSSAVQI